jgi:hypothetical protein
LDLEKLAQLKRADYKGARSPGRSVHGKGFFMKIAVLALVALGMMACSKEEAPAAAGAAKATPEANANAKPAEAKPADAKPAEAKPAEAPKAAAGEFKGLDGKPVVGYLKDPKDEGVCVILTAKDKAEADSMTKDKVAEVAKMMKAEVTDTCKTDGIVGACFAMGMLQNYYGPKYTKESAKAACDKDRGKWSE